MEKLHLNFTGLDNICKSICWIFSLISWLLFLITGWIAVFGEDYKIWTLEKKNLIVLGYHIYIPILIDESFIYIIFILTMGVSSVAFFFYLIYSLFIKTNGVFNGMMGSISRFHFIPFICASALFLIGEDIEDDKEPKDLIIASLIFSIIGFLTLILVHFKTVIDPWYISLLIKNGVFGCLIALFTYNICNCIFQIGFLKYYENLDLYTIFFELIKKIVHNKSDFTDYMNNCGIALPLAIGIVNTALSFALKDFMIAVINLLIFIGCTTYYYKIEDFVIKTLFDNSGADGVIDIIMIILSSITIALLIFLYRTIYFKF